MCNSVTCTIPDHQKKAQRMAVPMSVLAKADIVEDVLEASGITDFAGYAAVPGTPDDQLFPDIFL